MALWLVRTGSHGEHERQVLDTDRVYLTWSGLRKDLSKLDSRAEFQAVQREFYPQQSAKQVIQYAGQMRLFVRAMKPGDWVVVPCKTKAAINFAEVTGAYKYDGMPRTPTTTSAP